MRLDRWVQPMALLALSALLVGTMWVVPYLPTNDGPEWIFATHAENHYSDPEAPYAAAFEPALGFAARGLSVVYGPFEAWLGWQRGLQVALSVMVLLFAWGFVALVRALDRERWPIGLLGFPLALSWNFYFGFWSFAISTAVGLFILALAVSMHEPTWRGRSLIAFLLFIQAVTHVFGAVLTGGALLAVGLARAPRGKRLYELVWLTCTGLPAMGILLACVIVSQKQSQKALAHDFEWLPWRDAVAMFPRTLDPGSLARALLFTFALLAVAVVVTARALRASTRSTDRGVGIASVLLLLVGTFAPIHIPGWQFFSQRFVPLGVALAFAALPLENLPALGRRLAPVLLFTASAVHLALTYPFHRRLVSLCPDAIAGLATQARTTGAILPVVLRPTEQPAYDHIRSEVPFLNPLFHLGTLYAVVMGGLPAYSFGGNSRPIALYPFEDRADPHPRPLPDIEHYTAALQTRAFSHDLGYRNEVENELATFGAFSDEVVVFGAIPSDFALWRDRGFVTDWSSATTLLAHFEPCVIDFTVARDAASSPPGFDVRVGPIGVLSDVHPPMVVQGDGLAHFTLAPAPCGDVAVRARWEGAPSRSAFCSNANGEGNLLARVTRKSNVVACEGR